MANDIRTDPTEENDAKQTSLIVAILLFVSAYILIFITFFYEDTGVFFSPVLFRHPQAFAEFLAGALGPFVFPALHVGIASFFRKKRNASTRRNIFIGWSLLFILVNTVTLVSLISQQ